MAERRIEYLPITDLAPDPRNPKLHHMAGLASSMDRFGYTTPIELDERTGLIVSGHGRVEALHEARLEGRPPPEGVVVKDDQWLVPVTRGWSSQNDAEALAYIVAANTLTEVGDWDFDGLARAFEELTTFDFTLLETTGWTDKEARDLIDLMALPITPQDLSAQIGPYDPATFAPRISVMMTRDEYARYLKACGDAPDDHARFLRMLDAMEERRTVLDAVPWDADA